MTYTDKILAEFDEKFPNESFREWTMGCFYQDELRKQFLEVRAFLSSSIAQALAEDRVRVGKIIEESHWECPEHGLPKFQKTDCVECDSALEINVVLGALLSSLDKPLTDKK